MKFFGNGIVWDKELNKPLCTFVNGEFETIDQRTADILTKSGYESDGLGVLANNETKTPEVPGGTETSEEILEATKIVGEEVPENTEVTEDSIEETNGFLTKKSRRDKGT